MPQDSVKERIEDISRWERKMKIQVKYSVPDGKYCWRHRPPFSVCSYFDNEGGIQACTLFQENLEEDKTGVLKLTKCLNANMK